MRKFLLNVSEGLIEGCCELAFWHCGDELAVSIVEGEFEELCPELDSLVAVFDELAQHMSDILSEEVPCVDNHCRTEHLLLIERPRLPPLPHTHCSQLLLVEKSNLGDGGHEVILALEHFPCRLHRHPPVFGCLLAGANPQTIEILSEVDVGVADDMPTVLGRGGSTNSVSSQHSKKTLWRTPLGSVLSDR